MDQNYLLTAVLVLTVGVGVVLSIVNLLGASLYDIGQVRKQKERLGHPHTKRFRHRPLISIIIPTRNHEVIIERCLNSIIKNSYRKFEIVIVDDASTDDTKKVIKGFIKAHKNHKILLVSRRRYTGRGGAINAGFKKAKGELIMALDAHSLLEKNALWNIVQHLVMNNFSVLAPNLRIMEHPSIVGLMQQFKQLASMRSKKLNAVMNAEWDASGSGIVYTREVFSTLKGFKSTLWRSDIALSLGIVSKGNQKLRLHYASDVIVYSEPVTSYKSLFMQRYRQKLGSWQALRINKGLFFSRKEGISKSLSWFRLPLFIWGELMVLLEPLLVAYFIYLAISFQKPVFVAIGWLTMSFLFIFSIWADNRLPGRQKIKLTAYVPIMYPLLLVMTLIDVIATFASLVNIRKITPAKRKPPGSKRQPSRKFAPQS